MEIKKIIALEFIYYQQEAKDIQISMWAEELKNFKPEEVYNSYLKLRQNCTKVPMPLQIKSVLFNYPSSDEAWAILPKNEDDFGLWCEEMRTAYGIIRDLLSEDQIAARMAFKSCYETEVLKSKSENKFPIWSPTDGFKNNNKDSVLKMAISRGWIKNKDAIKWSPDIALPNANLLQIEAPKETFTDSVREENIKKFKDILTKIKKPEFIKQEEK